MLSSTTRSNRRAIVASMASLIGSVFVASTLWAVQAPGAPYAQVAEVSAEFDAAANASRTLIEAFMEDRGVPGLAVAVAVEGEVVWSEGFGYANVEHRIPVTTLTKFRSGSTAKPIAGAALARLYEQGRFELDVPIQTYVPSFPEKEYVITPRQLAGHQAGMRSYRPNSDEFFNIKRYTDLVDALEMFEDDPLMSEPGTEYSYSTFGTNLLGAAIQGAAGEPFLTVLQQLVLDPLKMASTVGDHSDSIISYRTSYYERSNNVRDRVIGGLRMTRRASATSDDEDGPGVLMNTPFSDNSNKWPGGGLLTTPIDLARFGSAHLKPGDLRSETLELLFTAQRTRSGEVTPYGMNWFIDTDPEGRSVVHHAGESVGGASFVLLYPGEGVVVALQCNLTRANYDDLHFRIGDLFIER